jgi:hypothetical protein
MRSDIGILLKMQRPIIYRMRLVPIIDGRVSSGIKRSIIDDSALKSPERRGQKKRIRSTLILDL